MRRIMLSFALMLWASQVEASLLFTPDFFTLDVRAVFNETGTNSFCWQCDDADPLNDFQAVLDFQGLSESWTDFVRVAAVGTGCRARRRTISGSTPHLTQSQIDRCGCFAA